MVRRESSQTRAALNAQVSNIVNGNVSIGNSAEADHAANADVAKNLDPDSSDWTTIDNKDTAVKEAATAYTDEQLAAALEEVAKKYLSKLSDDTAAGAITFLKGLLLGDGTHGIDEDGAALLQSVTGDTQGDGTGASWSVSKGGAAKLAELVTAAVKSEGFTTDDILAGKGYHMYADSDGKSHVVTDYLTTRIKAYFSELAVQKITYSGGNTIFTGAGNGIEYVEKVSNGNGDGYKCWFSAEDGDEEVENMWQAGDQALCKTAHMATGSGVGNRYYWRLVTGAGTDEKTFTASDGTTQTKKMGYVILSDAPASTLFEKIYADGDSANTEAANVITPDASRTYFQGKQADDNDAPAAGDAIVAMGSQSDKGRMKAIQIASVQLNSEPAPAINFYSGLNDFTMTPTFSIGTDGIKGDVKFMDLNITNNAGEPIQLYNYRGEWSASDTYTKGDMVTYEGQTWIWNSDTSTTATPSEADGWVVAAKSGGNGKDGKDGADGADAESPYKVEIITATGSVIKNGRGSTTLNAIVYQGEGRITDVSGIRFTWELYNKDGTTRSWNGTSSYQKTGTGSACASVTVTQDDVAGSANIICKINKSE